MLGIIQSWRSKNNLRKQLLAFLAEIEKNLETFYVMDQRQFITVGFLMTFWEALKDLDLIKHHKAISAYAASLLDFNKTWQEYKTFEQWYSSDTQNKTPDNAKKLHGLKNSLDQKIKPLEAVIITAGQSLEKELLSLGFISD